MFSFTSCLRDDVHFNEVASFFFHLQLRKNYPCTKNIHNETKPKPPAQSVALRLRSSVCRKLSLNERQPPSRTEQPVTNAEAQPYQIRIEHLNGDQFQYTYDTTQIDSNTYNLRSSIKKSVEQCHIPTIESHSHSSGGSVNSNISANVKCSKAKLKSQKILLLLKKLLVEKLKEVQKELRTEQTIFHRNPLLLAVLTCIRSLEIYAHSLVELKMSCTMKRNKAATGTASTTTDAVGEDVSRKVSRPNDDFAESTTIEKDGTTANSLQNRRTHKNFRTPDNVRMLLTPESTDDTNEKDSSKSLFLFCFR